MRLVSVVSDMLIDLVIFCLLVVSFIHKYKLVNQIIKSKKVILTGVFMLLSTAIISYVRLYGADMGLHALAVVILGVSAALSICDWEIHVVPNYVIMGALLFWTALTGLYVIFFPANGLALMFQSLIGGMIAGLIFFLCYVFSRHQLGAGDVKYAFMLGLYMTGSRMLGCIFYGTLMCCIFSVIQLIRKKITLHDGVALIPFLYLGIIITFLIM